MAEGAILIMGVTGYAEPREGFAFDAAPAHIEASLTSHDRALTIILIGYDKSVMDLQYGRKIVWRHTRMRRHREKRSDEAIQN